MIDEKSLLFFCSSLNLLGLYHICSSIVGCNQVYYMITQYTEYLRLEETIQSNDKVGRLFSSVINQTLNIQQEKLKLKSLWTNCWTES